MIPVVECIKKTHAERAHVHGQHRQALERPHAIDNPGTPVCCNCAKSVAPAWLISMFATRTRKM